MDGTAQRTDVIPVIYKGQEQAWTKNDLCGTPLVTSLHVEL